MRPYKTLDDVFEQVEFFVDAVSDYKSDFVLFPEYFNAPLMAKFNHLGEARAFVVWHNIPKRFATVLSIWLSVIILISLRVVCHT